MLRDLLKAIEKGNEKRALNLLRKHEAKELSEFRNDKNENLLSIALKKFSENSAFIKALTQKTPFSSAKPIAISVAADPNKTLPSETKERQESKEINESYQFVKQIATQTALASHRPKPSLSECDCEDMPRHPGLTDSPRDAMDELAIKWLTKTYPLSDPKNRILKLVFLHEGKCFYLANFIYKMNQLGYGIMAIAHEPGFSHFFAEMNGHKEFYPDGTRVDHSFPHAIEECHAVLKAAQNKFRVTNAFAHMFQYQDLSQLPEPCHAVFAVDVQQHLPNLMNNVLNKARPFLNLDSKALMFVSTVLNPKSKGAIAKLFVTPANTKDCRAMDRIFITIPPGHSPKRRAVETTQAECKKRSDAATIPQGIKIISTELTGDNINALLTKTLKELEEFHHAKGIDTFLTETLKESERLHTAKWDADGKSAWETMHLGSAAPSAPELSKKFPKSVTDNPCFEEAPPSTPKDKSEDYIKKQKEDFLKAIKYAENNILTQPIDSWTTDFLLKHLENLYKLCSKTLLTHPVSHLRISTAEFEKTNFRTQEVYFTKDVPEIEDLPPNFKFNLDYPRDIFSILYKAHGNEVAFNFIKWFIKWHPMTDSALKDLSSKLKELTLHYNQFNPMPKELIITALFHKHFDGKEIQNWVKTELAKNSKFSFAKDLHSLLNTNLRERIDLPGLYTMGEAAARDLVLKYFPTADEVPKRMAELIKDTIEMIQKKVDPITIACRFHHEMVNVIHPYYNANHRLARMMMNMILMSYGLPALEFDAGLRKEYNQASDAGYHPLERFIRKRIDVSKTPLDYPKPNERRRA